MHLLRLKSKLSQHRFEINHILVFFVVVILFQVVLVFFQGTLVTNFLNDAQRWFQKYHAERIAMVTSASLENLFENQQRVWADGRADEAQTVYSVNVFFKQLVMQRNIEEISLILLKDDRMFVVSNGQQMNEFFKGTLLPEDTAAAHAPLAAVTYFTAVKQELLHNERILSEVVNQKTFNVLVPFVPYGEFVGALYVRISPDFTLLTASAQSPKATTLKLPNAPCSPAPSTSM